MSDIKTYTGIMMDPTKPRPEQLCIEDIAHALPMLCRANGHFQTFYSVGQHSINCMKEAKARGYSPRLQLACLLHDGSEAYLSDVTRPVKQELPAYKLIEEPLQDMIWNKWLEAPLTKEETELVFDVDNAMLYHEFIALMNGTKLYDHEPPLSAVPEFSFRGFEPVQQEFLDCFYQLLNK